MVFKNPRKKGLFYKHSGNFIIQSAIQVNDIKPAPAPGYYIKFHATSVEMKDMTGTSDPFLKIYTLKQTQQGEFPLVAHPHQNASSHKNKNKYVLISKTEAVTKTLNPTWQPIRLDTGECGGLDGNIKIECWDFDKSLDHDFIGECHVTLRDMLYSKPVFLLINPSKSGHVTYYNSGILHVNEVHPDNNTTKRVETAYNLTFCGTNLSAKDLSGFSDPYFVIKVRIKPQWSYPYSADPIHEAILRGKKKKKDGMNDSSQNIDHKLVQIYRSEVLKSTLNPNFSEFQLNTVDVGGIDNLLYFEVYDWDSHGEDDMIGGFQTTLRELTMIHPSFTLKTKRGLTRTGGCFHLENLQPTRALFDQPPYALRIGLRAEKVERKDLCGLGASDPFLLVYAWPYTQEKECVIYQTEVIRTTTAPTWKQFTAEISQLGGLDSNIRFECWDHDDSGNSDFVCFSSNFLFLFWGFFSPSLTFPCT
eukprot:TRINITY_DN4308_c0_g1_i10.p1 TRINITY_DN4308_c0_g1~~TRINITY_DN4308_c0_g1_i10.p1  ORF type:complete len:475 (-),score=101.22 TRINITY_DN4308_c0_g1_i10:627-2051(-)